MPDASAALREQAIDYIAAWVAHHIGEPSGEITVHEMQEFLYQHGFELAPPDEETTFTATDYWTAVLRVATDRIAPSDRVISIAWKE